MPYVSGSRGFGLVLLPMRAGWLIYDGACFGGTGAGKKLGIISRAENDIEPFSVWLLGLFFTGVGA